MAEHYHKSQSLTAGSYEGKNRSQLYIIANAGDLTVTLAGGANFVIPDGGHIYLEKCYSNFSIDKGCVVISDATEVKKS